MNRLAYSLSVFVSIRIRTRWRENLPRHLLVRAVTELRFFVSYMYLDSLRCQVSEPSKVSLYLDSLRFQVSRCLEIHHQNPQQ